MRALHSRSSLRWVVLSLWTGLSLACGEPPTAPAPRVLQVSARVLDSAGQPLPSTAVALRLWRTEGGVLERPEHLTDSLGYARWRDTLPISAASLDSVTATAYAYQCGPAPRREVRQRLALADSQAVTLVLSRLAPLALTPHGQYCGVGLDRFGQAAAAAAYFVVRWAVDSLGADSAWGRWEVEYQASRRTEYGPFRGARDASALVLHLEPGATFAGCRPVYELVAPLGAAGTLGPARLRAAGGCTISEVPFELGPDTAPGVQASGA